ncbi:hypothetical protein BVX94_00520 [bacterium B17]|nr:hypothetical protein BVX94_00520 [bacterium B17]
MFLANMKLTFRMLCLALISGCMFMQGCASSRSADIDRLIREMETEDILAWNTDSRTARTTPKRRLDSPDSADIGLPPLNIKRTSPAEPIIRNYSPEDLEVTIQPGCLVRVGVKEDSELDGNYEVNDIGAISLGYIGPIILQNKNAMEAAKKITAILTRRDFRRATVAVKIVRPSYDRVYIGGGVNSPGEITIGSGDTITLNDALLRADGIVASVKGARVRIISGGLTNAMAYAAKGTLYSLVNKNGKAVVPHIVLKNNDVAVVLSTSSGAVTGGGEKEITVLGEVKKPGVFKFANGEPCTIMHLMFKVGEMPIFANRKEVKIFRKNSRGHEEEIVVNVEKIMDKGQVDEDVAPMVDARSFIIIRPRLL